MAPRTKAKQNKAQASKEKSEHNQDEDISADDGPPAIDPYEVLGLDKEASADDVKKAYRKQALQHHPDKAAEDSKEAAKQKFQEIAFAYAVLSDDRRRMRYDLTGSTVETLEDDEEFDWLTFYRQQFEDVVNQENIDRIANEYKGSPEERRDLLRVYEERKGRLDDIYARIMLSDILVDDDRFRKILDEEIAKGNINSYDAYERTNNDKAREKAKHIERGRREAFDKQESKKAANGKSNSQAQSKKSGNGDLGSLAALIQQRQKARSGNFFDHLEAKYAPPSKGGKRSTPMDEPSEEAFAAMAARKKTKSSGRAKKVLEDETDEEEDIDDEEDDEKPRASSRGPRSKKSCKTQT